MTDPYLDGAADVGTDRVPSPGRQEGATEPKRPWYRKRRIVIPLTAVIGVLLGLILGTLGERQLREADVGDLLAQLDAAEEEVAEAEQRATEAEEAAEEAEQALADVADLQAELAEQEEALAQRAEELGAIEEAEEALETAEASGEGIGSTVHFNDWDISLIDVEVHSSIGGSTSRGKFVALILDVTNNASTQRDFMGGFDTDFRLVDPTTDREYSFDSSASLEHHHTFRTDTWHLEDIGPGFTARLPIVFDVGEETRGGMAAMVAGRDVSDFFFIRLE